jgi:TolB-like protein
MRHLPAGAALLSLIVTGSGTCRSAAASAADAEPRAGKILVLPFAPLNPADPRPWVGKSIQQSVAADLTAASPGQVISAEKVTATDADSAIREAKRAGAAFVLLGSFVTAGDDLRVTGQVLDAGTGKPVAAVKATGPAAELFTLEDELTAQIRRRVDLTAARPTTRPAQAADESVPPMEPLRVARAGGPEDPYVQTYVDPLNGANSPDRRQLDYDYYFGQPGASPYLVAGFGGLGFGLGVGCTSYGYGAAWVSSSAWGGVGGSAGHASAGARGVNPTAGTALAPGVVFHSSAAGRAARH